MDRARWDGMGWNGTTTHIQKCIRSGPGARGVGKVASTVAGAWGRSKSVCENACQRKTDCSGRGLRGDFEFCSGLCEGSTLRSQPRDNRLKAKVTREEVATDRDSPPVRVRRYSVI